MRATFAQLARAYRVWRSTALVIGGGATAAMAQATNIRVTRLSPAMRPNA